jgi:trimethylamine--corrinoid protein Co-methyltransferase
LRGSLSILSENEIQEIHRSSLGILERDGVLVRSQEAVTLLTQAGANSDGKDRKVRLPSSLVEECLRKHPSTFHLSGRTRENDLLIEPGKIHAHPCGGCFNILDSDSGESRIATSGDVEVLTRLMDALTNIDESEMLDYAGDTPQEVRDIYTIVTMLRNTTKPCGVLAYSDSNLETILRLAAVIVGGEEELRKRPIISFGASPTSPLELSEDVANQVVRAAKFGLPISILPCPLAGATSPVTLAGTLLQQNVEFLICDVIIQLVNPGNPIIYCPRSMSVDMRTGIAAGEVEYGLMSAAAVQLAERYKMPSDVYGLAADSKVLDEQAAFEKAMVGLLPALAGANFLSGAGEIEMGVTASVEQLVIDDEMLGMIFRAVRGIDVNTETLAAALIGKTGPGGHFLSAEHTRKYYSSEHHVLELCDRTARADWQKAGSKDIVRRAREKANRLLKDHSVESLDRDVEEEVQRILREVTRKSQRKQNEVL